MILFISLASVVTLLVTGYLLIVITGRSQEQDDQTEQKIFDIYKSRYAELDRDFEEGLINQEELEQARQEITRSMTRDNRFFTGPEKYTESKNHFLPVLCITLFIPLLSIVVYLVTGHPQSLLQSREALNANAFEHPPVDVNAMVRQLEQRLEQSPEDIRGWQMLTRSYLTLGRYDEAVTAAKKLNELKENEPTYLVMYVDALIMSNGGEFNREARDLIDKSLALAPEDPPTLWLAGMAAYQAKEFKMARNYWQTLLGLVDQDSEVRAHLEELLEEIGKRENS
ncbi:MAG: c-type cytochrome biogenesis protein CcmI [Gammaproteobacteria bacterium]|nr:c-type cytochrome biogenesis protein CcmI [Gammaproteobacteria bacterium]